MRWAPHLEVSYCTNVHPGEGLSALHQMIAQDLAQVKRRISPKSPLGTGLRLGAESVFMLRDPAELTSLRRALEEHELYIFSVNGFPYGDFAAPEVKQAVYDPDWSTGERARYTIALARALAHLPGPRYRSISTVAGGFEPQADRLDRQALAQRAQRFHQSFAQVAAALHELEEETGVCVRVALEPEPWTSLERVEEVAPFFERYVWPSSPHAQRYWGLCYDACHQALAYEEPHASWRTLRDAGVPIYKVQISNALRLTNPRDTYARAQLLSFAEPRYLHQVTALTARGEVLRALDLPELMEPTEEWLNALEWRCHFHVPIWWRGEHDLGTEQTQSSEGALQTTRDFWEELAVVIREESAQPHTSAVDPLHIEVETYSWGVLPEALRRGRTLLDDIAQELEVLRAHLNVNVP